MNRYVLVIVGTNDPVQIEEGLYYGQPTKETGNVRYFTKEELNKYLENPYFSKNIHDGKCEIKKITFSFSEPIKLREKVEIRDKKWELDEGIR